MPLTFTKRGAGDAMVFLHGFPCTRHLWEPVIERLSQAGFSCIAPDLLGYGESPSATNVGMAAQVPHLLALLNALGLEKVELVAHDVGTAAAQLFALQHPQRLKRLFLMDGVYETEWAMTALESIRCWNPSEASRLQPLLARRLKPIRELLSAYAGDHGGRQLIHAARCLDPSETRGATARLRAIGLPGVGLCGTHDTFLPLDTVGRPLANALAVGVITIEGGHFVPLDNPEAVAEAILDAR